MDDRTLQYMRQRVDEAERINRAINDWSHKRRDAEASDLSLGRSNGSGYQYSVGVPIPQEAREIIIKNIDATIADLRDQLAKL